MAVGVAAPTGGSLPRTGLTASLIALALCGDAAAGPSDPDPSFGSAGVASLSLQAADVVFTTGAVRPDGKVVAVGYTQPMGGGPRAPLIAQFLSNGLLDRGFSASDGAGYHVAGDIGDAIYSAVALGPGDAVIAAGHRGTAVGDSLIIADRYLPTGLPDGFYPRDRHRR